MSDTAKFNDRNIRPLGEHDLNILKRGDKMMLWGALAIAIIALVFAGVSARTKEPIVRDYGTLIEQREVLIVQTDKRNAWLINDAATGETIVSYLSGGNDFLSGQIPGIQRNRQLVNADQSQPYHVRVYDSGAFLWHDPETGREMLLHRMGPAPRQSVAKLLLSQQGKFEN